MSLRVVSFYLFALLSACMGPRPPLPPDSRIEAPVAWRGGERIEGHKIDARWWRELHDGALDALVERALVDNDDLRIAIARVNAARAALRLSRSTWLPHVDLEAAGERDAGINPFGLADQESRGGFGARIDYDADIFGGRHANTAAAAARLSESQAQRDAIRLGVAAAATDSYISLRALDARLAIAKSTLALRADSLKVAKRRYALGYSTALDLKQAEAEYLATQRLLPELQNAIKTQEDGLSVLLGNIPDAIVRGVALTDLSMPEIPHTLPSAVVLQRPDIYAAEQHLAAADHALSAARAAFLPDIALEAGAGRAFSTLYPEPITLWSVGGSILAPLFEGGALRAQQSLAVARREQAAFAYRRAVLTAFREVEDQMTAIESTGEEIKVLKAQQDALAVATRLATRRYRTGYSSYLEQLDAERNLLATQLALVEMQADRLIAYVDLFRAMGGGWQRPESAAQTFRYERNPSREKE